jgi:hypothetical protein
VADENVTRYCVNFRREITKKGEKVMLGICERLDAKGGGYIYQGVSAMGDYGVNLVGTPERSDRPHPGLPIGDKRLRGDKSEYYIYVGTGDLESLRKNEKEGISGSFNGSGAFEIVLNSIPEECFERCLESSEVPDRRRLASVAENQRQRLGCFARNQGKYYTSAKATT